MKKLINLIILLTSFFNAYSQMIISTGYNRQTQTFYSYGWMTLDDFWLVKRKVDPGTPQNAVLANYNWSGILPYSRWISYDHLGKSAFFSSAPDTSIYSTSFNLSDSGVYYSLDIQFYVDNFAEVFINGVNVNNSPYCQNSCLSTTFSGTSGIIKVPINNTILQQGTNVLSVVVKDFNSGVRTGLNLTGIVNYFPPLPCINCIGSFAPDPGKKYLLSAWVKEENAPLTKNSYDKPQIYIEYPNLGTSQGPFIAKGSIIDGWQRVEEEFIIPLGAAYINLKLNSLTDNCFFDDIRIFPFDGSIKSFVYDPVSLRLVAELDERNYATLYEYDEEGKLVRVKKETERGVMTIKENKNSINKK